MNWDQIKGKWVELKGSVKSKWGDLTDDEIAEMQGDREKMTGKLQQKYGKSKEEINKEIDEWQRNL